MDIILFLSANPWIALGLAAAVGATLPFSWPIAVLLTGVLSFVFFAMAVSSVNLDSDDDSNSGAGSKSPIPFPQDDRMKEKARAASKLHPFSQEEKEDYAKKRTEAANTNDGGLSFASELGEKVSIKAGSKPDGTFTFYRIDSDRCAE